MTFDLQAARHHADTGGLMNTTKWLHAALDEIEQLQSREQQLKLDVGRLHNHEQTFAARIKELIAHETALTNRLSQEVGHTQAQRDIIDGLEARIKDLEGWLVEAQARGDFLQSLVPVDWESCSEGHKNIWRLGARQQLLDRATEVGNCAP